MHWLMNSLLLKSYSAANLSIFSNFSKPMRIVIGSFLYCFGTKSGISFTSCNKYMRYCMLKIDSQLEYNFAYIRFYSLYFVKKMSHRPKSAQ